MKHVLHCLHHMAEHGQEQMFVLTQFNYNDYLKNPGEEYIIHHIPVLDDLENKNKDSHIGCFDVLIIHRQYGVVIGVVKSLSDKDDCSQEGERRTDVQLAKDISEGIEQLTKADRVIKHLMRDQQQVPTVRLTLMLPNVARSTLQRTLDNHGDVAQNLCHCMKTVDWATRLCLCADDLSNPLSPWDVDSTVLSHLKNWWDNLMSCPVADSMMSEDLYQTMISRFCGPATVSSLELLSESTLYQLPKILDQCVSLTGDLCERLTLYPGMKKLLDEPQRLLVGPPGTGKTRMLALVGRKWISEGHLVYVINTCAQGGAATTQLEKLLNETPVAQFTDGNFTQNMVIQFFGRINDDKEINISIDKLINDAKTRKTPIFAVLDELGHDVARSRQGTIFVEKLLRRLPNLHLWAATCRSDILPTCLSGKVFSETLCCPPSVVRESQVDPFPDMSPYTYSNRLTPTDGLPVKNFYHQSQGHKPKEPRDCDVCGRAIVTFIKENLHVAASCEATANENTASGQETWKQLPPVQWKDILFLFEIDITENVPLMKCLLESGIPVQIINYGNQVNILMNDKNTALAAKAGFLFGLKRKVVVYVEGSINRSDNSAKWNRLRGITSCISQLVVVRMS